MSDSEDKKSPQALPTVPPEGTSLVVVKTKEGGLREMLTNEKGHIVKKSKPLIPTVEFTRKERKILYSPSKDKGKEGMTEHEVSFKNVLRISQNESEDPKAMMAAVKAYEIVMRRALGKEASSEQDLDRITTQPVKTIIVVSPELMNPKVVEADKAVEKPKQPSFAEVLDITTNEK